MSDGAFGLEMEIEGIDFPRISKIVGLQFRKGAKNRVAAFEGGEVLWLSREPDNQYDVNAIQVFEATLDADNNRARGEFFFGYIPKEEAMLLAPIMDAGADIVPIVQNASSEILYLALIEPNKVPLGQRYVPSEE